MADIFHTPKHARARVTSTSIHWHDILYIYIYNNNNNNNNNNSISLRRLYATMMSPRLVYLLHPSLYKQVLCARDRPRLEPGSAGLGGRSTNHYATYFASIREQRWVRLLVEYSNTRATPRSYLLIAY